MVGITEDKKIFIKTDLDIEDYVSAIQEFFELIKNLEVAPNKFYYLISLYQAMIPNEKELQLNLHSITNMKF